MKCGRANMKTIKNLIGKICTFPNAIKAYMKARKCKRLRPEVLEFEQNREDNLQKAIDAIQSGDYTPGKYRIFKSALSEIYRRISFFNTSCATLWK